MTRNDKLDFLTFVWTKIGGPTPRRYWLSDYATNAVIDRLKEITTADEMIAVAKQLDVVDENFAKAIEGIHQHWVGPPEDTLSAESKQAILDHARALGISLTDLHISDVDRRVLTARWDLADMLYQAEKSKAIDSCGRSGVDLQKGELDFSFGRFPDIVESCQAILLKLLEWRIQYDLAAIAVARVSDIPSVKARTQGRLRFEFLDLLDMQRPPLWRLYEDPLLYIDRQQPTRGEVVWRTEEVLKPFIKRFESFAKALPAVPRPEIYDQLHKLVEDKAPVFHFQGDHVEKKTTFKGPVQAGNIGDFGTVQNTNFNQAASLTALEGVDLSALASELGTLAKRLQANATTPEQASEAGIVSGAAQQAAQGNGAKALEFLKKTGSWVLTTAKEIGVNVAAEVLGKVLLGK